MKDCDLLIRGAVAVTPTLSEQTDLAVKDGKIAALGAACGSYRAAETVDAEGLHLLPGLIDSQVHFRQPGLTHKETIADGSAAALAGGVTTFLEMPNTDPPTIDEDKLAEKLAIAAETSRANYGFFIGATVDNVKRLANLERLEGVAGVKMFMGSSTGKLLVEEEATVREILSVCRRRIAVHAEDEAILRRHRDRDTHLKRRPAEAAIRATEMLLKLADKTPIHILHISTAEELEMIAAAGAETVSCEATPQHLTLTAPQCYERLGALAQMNPPIRERRHRRALWRALNGGVIKTIGSDHAPHTLEEKKSESPPSGMPGVETMLPIMLTHVAAQRLSLNKLAELTSYNPSYLFAIKNKGRLEPGFDADLVLVDCLSKFKIDQSKLHSKCGWSPFDGMTAEGRVEMVFLGGRAAMINGELLDNAEAKRIETNLPGER